MYKVAAQFIVQLGQRRRQHFGSRFDHRLCPDRMKHYSMYNYSSMYLYVQILRQVVRARGRLYVPKESFYERSD